MIEEGPTYVIESDPLRITCKVCNRTSFNENDVKNLYCGHCHAFHEPTPAAAPSVLRTQAEIQRAHDLLLAVILKDVELPFSETTRGLISVSASVLCWCLRHEHNDAFDRNLKIIENAVALAGYVVRDKEK